MFTEQKSRKSSYSLEHLATFRSTVLSIAGVLLRCRVQVESIWPGLWINMLVFTIQWTVLSLIFTFFQWFCRVFAVSVKYSLHLGKRCLFCTFSFMRSLILFFRYYQDIEYSLPLECTPRNPITFELPIRFQQTSEPVEANFSLDTRFFLLNRQEQWTSNKFTGSEATDVAFTKGESSVSVLKYLIDSFVLRP